VIGSTPAQAGIGDWPEESEEKLPDRSKCRLTNRKLLSDHLQEAESYSQKLKAANQPALQREEVIAATLYTGPVREPHPFQGHTNHTLLLLLADVSKVQRGAPRCVNSSSEFLKGTMVKLCCPKAVAEAYAAGGSSFELAIKSLNKYTTTLHAINSAIIKLGKLNKATKVYRGIAGKALPLEFWEPTSLGSRLASRPPS
jgi:NLR family CARD domain-containing protein 3